MTLKEMILKKAEFDFITESQTSTIDYVNGREDENVRLRDLIMALTEAVEAIEFYAAENGNKFQTKWENDHVCDSYSGALSTFDWDGDLQDEPWEIARKAKERLKQKLEEM